jgi:hypothetical protein
MISSLGFSEIQTQKHIPVNLVMVRRHPQVYDMPKIEQGSSADNGLNMIHAHLLAPLAT